ncbi:hypothetical protein [Campylobacter canadensis]|uniref:Uncharacterized protein n=1 Tax=Campylobacter canadensis TaxID=449520 RepID=A0ABS7WQY3_9BACT|nr:hypothetical protein [Campylobacter canadensis]MBZ7987168.1 hypothetical protein [Campylobacter canadensis]MBZ7998208.1 hypothetical protein [Campylobacter canadensis]
MNDKNFQKILEELIKENKKDIKNDKLLTTETIFNEIQPREDRDTSKWGNNSYGRGNVKDTTLGVRRYGFTLQGEEIKHRIQLSDERNRTQSRSTARENTSRTRISTSEEISQSSKRLRATIQRIARYGREGKNAKIIDNDNIIKTKSNAINNNIYKLKKTNEYMINDFQHTLSLYIEKHNIYNESAKKEMELKILKLYTKLNKNGLLDNIKLSNKENKILNENILKRKTLNKLI